MSELRALVDSWKAKGGQTTTDLVKDAAAKAAFKHLCKDIFGETLVIRYASEEENESSRAVDGNNSSS